MKPVVVGVDGSPCARDALQWAVAYAAEVSAPLLAVTALPYHEDASRALDDDDLRQRDGVLEATKEWLRLEVETAKGSSAIDADIRVRQGQPAAELLAAAGTATAVVVGSRGEGAAQRFLVGSVSDLVLRHAHCPLVLVPRGRGQSSARGEPPPRVIVGYDGSSASREALAWAADHARLRGASLTIVRAWDAPTFQGVPITLGRSSPDRDALESVERAARGTGLPDSRVDTVVAQGSPADLLLKQAEQADLLVVGSRGAGGFERLLLGSTSARCAHHASCPVVVVPSSDPVT